MVSLYISKSEQAMTNDLMLHLKLLKKEEQVKPRGQRRQEIREMRAEINALEMKKTIQTINESELVL